MINKTMLNDLRIALLLMSLSIFNIACADVHVERPIEWGTLIHKTNNFYRVSSSVYRSKQPSKEFIPLLKQHNIDIILNLRVSNKDKILFKDLPFQLKHVPIRTYAMSKENLLDVMKVIQDAHQQNKNVLIHCYHGSDRTGATIAMYRIIFENWSTENALHEMKTGGYGFHPIWSNLEKLFSPENIKWIQQELSNPST